MTQNQPSTIQDRMQAMQEKNPFLTAYQIVYTLLREDIITCRLEPGTKLTEEFCTQRYCSSRTTIRKAFDMLVDEGWLERSEGHRIRVSVISQKDHMNTMEYRMAIEPTAARLAARNRTREQLQTIEKYVKLCNTTDIYMLHVNDLHFHRAVFAASQNKYLVEANGLIDLKVSRSKLYTVPDYQSACKECYQEHYEIYEAIRTGDEVAAHRASFQHIKMMLDANLE